jgi:pyrroline-5-carboxylate reductase
MASLSPILDPLADQRLVLIGVGVIGSILLQRLEELGFPQDQLLLCDADPERGARLQQEFGLKTCPLADACCRADIWLIATPPRAVIPTLRQLGDRLRPGHLVISFAASVPLARIEAVLPRGVAAARIMPNALSLIGRGVNPVAYGRGRTLMVMAQVQAILNALGDSIVIDDAQMDWAVGLTGASMRWLVPVLEGMTNAGLDAGLSAADARWLAAKMMAGVAALALETDLSYDEMLSLTSLQVVDEEEISLIFYDAAHRARERAEEMTRDLARND